VTRLATPTMGDVPYYSTGGGNVHRASHRLRQAATPEQLVSAEPAVPAPAVSSPNPWTPPIESGWLKNPKRTLDAALGREAWEPG
jgi:hypothetical protein